MKKTSKIIVSLLLAGNVFFYNIPFTYSDTGTQFSATANAKEVLFFNFDNDTIINTVSNKTYTSLKGTETYPNGKSGKGIDLSQNGILIPKSDLQIENEDSITVSFWMNWDGNIDGSSNTNGFIPIGFGKYTLWFNNGDFGFNTGNNDIYGVKNAIPSSAFTKITATFYKNDVTKNTLYINGVKQTLSQVRGTPNSSNVNLSGDLRIGGWLNTDLHPIPKGTIIDEIEINKNLPPVLNATPSANNVTLNWAMDITNEDVIYEQPFKSPSDITFYFGYADRLGFGNQSLQNEVFYPNGKDTGAYKVFDTINGGNGNIFPYLTTDKSRMNYGQLKLPNGSKISATFKLKTTKNASMRFSGDGGWEVGREFDYHNTRATQTAPAGAREIEVDDITIFPEREPGSNVPRDRKFVTSDTDKDVLKDNITISKVIPYNDGTKKGKIVLNGGLVTSIQAGDQLKTRRWATPVSFTGGRTFTSADPQADKNGWITTSINTSVENNPYYITQNRGFQLIMDIFSDGTTYIDDFKIGYASESILYRDNQEVYKGFLVDYVDNSATDTEKPNAVSNIRLAKKKENELAITFDSVVDNGSTYTYTVKGKGTNGETPMSLPQKVTVTSGIKGYEYKIDTNSSTSLDTSSPTFTTATTLTTNYDNQNRYYLHIRTVDNAGNKGETIHQSLHTPLLQVTPVIQNNYMQLDWNMNPSTDLYTYKVFQKKEGDTTFQSISATDLNKKIKVLNIYPTLFNGVPIGTDTFMTYEGKTYTLPKSAGLKKWMEVPNEEDAKGYGKGMIEVEPVSDVEFKSNPKKYVRDAENNFAYDVIYVGHWDGASNTKYYTAEELAEFESFIQSGRGFLAGHDTIGYNWGTTRGLSPLRNYFNIKVGYWRDPDTKNDVDPGHNYFNAPTGTKVKIMKKGLLTSTPWNIGDENRSFDVPYTHTTSNFAYGDIWMSLDSNTYFSDKEQNAPSNLLDKGKFYLTTWNNTAMIQAGHSNGQATPDEQKIFANTLFYLSQLTSETSLKDYSGQDVKAPSQSKINSIQYNTSTDTVSFSYVPSKEEGNDYEYYVEATNQNTNEVIQSNIVKTNITSGFKGYSIVVDDKENTIPDDTVETTDASFELKNPHLKDMYVHVKAMDHAGNYTVSHHRLVTNTLSVPTDSLKFNGIDSNIKFDTIPFNAKAGEKNTIELWLKWEGDNMDIPLTIKGNQAEGGNTNGVSLYFKNGYFGLNANTGDIFGIPSSEMKGKWTHVAVVLENGVPLDENNIKLYINGQKQIISLWQFSPNLNQKRYLSGELSLGNYFVGNQPQYYFRGDMAQFRAWKGERTESEISQNWNQQLTGKEPNLVGYWEMSSLTNDKVYDQTTSNVKGLVKGSNYTTPLTMTDEGTDDVSTNVKWNTVPKADSYLLSKDGNVVTTTNETTYQDTTLQSNTNYRYDVYAKNKFGNSISTLRSVTSKEGALDIMSVPATVQTTNKKIEKDLTSIPFSLPDPIHIKDTRSSYGNWKLQVNASPFVSSHDVAKTLPYNSLSMQPKFTVSHVKGAFGSNQTQSTKQELQIDNNNQHTIVNSNANEGFGYYKIDFSPESFNLAVNPATLFTGSDNQSTYKSTITWSLVTGP